MNFVLKFTDRNIDTIDEHIKIIEKNGYVWWGWWKKESEPSRLNELNQIKKSIPIQIGLFEGSSDRYYVAEVEEIDFLDDNQRVSSPDKAKTPPYYNEKRVPAWLKIIAIEKTSEKLFIEKFGRIPAEDYSFFDTSENSKESSKKARVSVESEYIIHLSDIHFGDDHAFPLESKNARHSLLDQIIDDLEDLEISPGLVIITGDLTTRANSNRLFDTALPFLNSLADSLHLNKSNFLIIPGNHDIPLNDVDFTSYEHETTFKFFLDKFFEEDKQIIGLDHFVFKNGLSVDFLRMNSIKLRTKEDMNFGYLNWRNYRRFVKDIDKNSSTLKIALLHHHLVSAPKIEDVDIEYPSGSMSSTIDSGLIINELQALNFKLVLNGHQHLPTVSKVARGYLNEDNPSNLVGLKNNLYIISGGSAGVVKDRWSDQVPYNTYGIYRISKPEIEIIVRKFNPKLKPSLYFKTKIPME